MKAMHLIAVPVGIAVLLRAVALMHNAPAPAPVDKVAPLQGTARMAPPVASPKRLNGASFHVRALIQMTLFHPDYPEMDWFYLQENGTSPITRIHYPNAIRLRALLPFRPWICDGRMSLWPTAPQAEVANAGMTYRDSVLAYLHASLSLSKTTLGTAGSVVDQQDP